MDKHSKVEGEWVVLCPGRRGTECYGVWSAEEEKKEKGHHRMGISNMSRFLHSMGEAVGAASPVKK
eukprot:25249-Rhodomonas_salina.2